MFSAESLRRRTTEMVALLAVLAAAAACSTGTTNSSSDGTKHYTLSVGLTGAAAAEADVFIAEAEGYFAAENLTVNVQVVGSTVAAEVAAGDINVALVGATSALAPTAQGHPMKIFYSALPGELGANVLVRSGSPFKSLMDLSGKKVAVLGVGTASYGDGVSYSNYVASHGGKPFQLVPATSAAALVSELISGQVDAELGETDEYASYIDSHRIRVLASGTSAVVKKNIMPSDILGASYMTLASFASSNGPALTAFVIGLRKADHFLQTQSAKVIAQALKKSSQFGNVSESSLEQQIPFARPFYAPTAGEITMQGWKDSLAEFGTWGLQNVDVKSALYSYGNMIDMTFWKTAASGT
jgi:ABC-type nitrate/sulfonate/bicarbonate transport system substrate-binding protein